ncbi:MAG: sensor histidine kinase, partial [bacterium]
KTRKQGEQKLEIGNWKLVGEKNQKSAIKSLSRVVPRDQKSVVWSVRDNGIGIPKESQKNMFEKFKRGKNANKMNTDGSGLGLFIVKKLVNAHPNAEVGFTSAADGSEFWVKFGVA